MIFAVSAVPLIGLIGGAVDLTRHHRYKVELLNAMDSAAIALARRGAEDDADADQFINDYVNAIMPMAETDDMLHVGDLDATEIEGGWRIESNGYMDTAFMPVVGFQSLPLSLTSEVVTTGGNYEVALALDNTGSMARNGKIGALKTAANHLIDVLYEETGADDRVKMALVPCTTAVNIRGEAFDPSWLDPEGLGLGTHRFDSYDRAVSRLDIFDSLSNGAVGTDGLPTAWKGCVEARADGYDTDDTVPGGDAATRWMPYLSPDGADEDETGGGFGWGWGRSYLLDNSYLNDRTRGKPRERLRNVDKYLAPIVSASFYPFDTETGPNQSCRGPIVELTNDRDRMRTAISAMEPGGYTHIPQGLVWGWRVLSPAEPFTQGVDYGDVGTQKALVLLSDGKNTFPETYTSYGYRADGRLASSEAAGVSALNDKVSTICERVKAKGIRLYMILLEENDADTKQIFEDCASVNDEGETLYYEVPDASELTDVFGVIGDDLASIRISR